MIRVSRRQFLAGLGVGCVAVAGNGFIVEPRRVVITRHRLGGAAREKSFRLVQITDLHLQHLTGHTRRIARTIDQLAPDLVLFTGDMIDRADRVKELAAFLRLLDHRSTKLATLGNWEHWGRVNLDELDAAYTAAGCRLLINESVPLEHDSGSVLITGLDDWTAGSPDFKGAVGTFSGHRRHIIAAHSPVQRDVLAEAERDWLAASPDAPCVLSGHTHGGQIALGGWAPVRPAGSGRYVAGWYRDRSPWLYVSRGLGTSIVPVRFGAPPEIAYFEWIASPL